MSEWRRYKLKELGRFFDGPHATPTRTDSGPYFLNISSLVDGRLDLSQSDHVSADDFIQWTRRVTPTHGDLLFSYETRLGDAAMMPSDTVACLGRRMALIRPNVDLIDPRYLLYHYLSPGFQQLIDSNTIHGATVNRIALSSMPDWVIDVPPLHEQQAIAEVLGALDDKIAANTKLAQVADQLASSLVLQRVDRDHFVPLNEIADITMGSSPRGESFNERREGTAFFQGIRDFGLRFPSNRVWTTSPTRLAEKGDSLISVRAPVGRVNLAGESLCIGRGLAAAHSKLGTPYTLFSLLKSTPNIWEPFEAGGTVFGSINRTQLNDIHVPRLLDALDTCLEARLSALGLRIDCALAENRTLAATRDALLPQLMSGKLRVKDAEKVVENAG